MSIRTIVSMIAGVSMGLGACIGYVATKVATTVVVSCPAAGGMDLPMGPALPTVGNPRY